MKWVCEVCGYLHDDDELPGVCPVCGAPRGKFAEYFTDEVLGAKSSKNGMDDFDKDLFADYEDE